MSSYQPHQPYLYAIGWSHLDRWYLGVRFAAGCEPADLWTKYFTSSKKVKAMREQHGEPDHLEILAVGSKDRMIAAEAEYLAEWQLHKDPRWLNRNIAGHTFHTAERPPHTPETRKRISSTLRARPENLAAAERKAVQEAEQEARRVAREVKRISRKPKGDPRPEQQGRKRSDSTKAKMRDAWQRRKQRLESRPE